MLHNNYAQQCNALSKTSDKNQEQSRPEQIVTKLAC